MYIGNSVNGPSDVLILNVNHLGLSWPPRPFIHLWWLCFWDSCPKRVIDDVSSKPRAILSLTSLYSFFFFWDSRIQMNRRFAKKKFRTNKASLRSLTVIRVGVCVTKVTIHPGRRFTDNKIVLFCWSYPNGVSFGGDLLCKQRVRCRSSNPESLKFLDFFVTISHQIRYTLYRSDNN